MRDEEDDDPLRRRPLDLVRFFAIWLGGLVVISWGLSDHPRFTLFALAYGALVTHTLLMLERRGR